MKKITSLADLEMAMKNELSIYLVEDAKKMPRDLDIVTLLTSRLCDVVADIRAGKYYYSSDH